MNIRKDREHQVMEAKQNKCADLVENQMWERSSQIEDLNNIISESEDVEKIDEAIMELGDLPLEITTFKIVKVLFSTGGPGDWIEIKLNDEDDVLGVTYHYQDWFDHAQIKVPESSYLWDYAIQLIDTL